MKSLHFNLLHRSAVSAVLTERCSSFIRLAICFKLFNYLIRSQCRPGKLQEPKLFFEAIQWNPLAIQFNSNSEVLFTKKFLGKFVMP